MVTMVTNDTSDTVHDANTLTTVNVKKTHNTNVIATNETNITKVTTTVNKTMEKHLATETHVTKTSHNVQDVQFVDGKIVQTTDRNVNQISNNENVNVKHVMSSTQEVPNIALENMAQGNMTTTMTTAATEGAVSEIKAKNLQTVKADVVNVDLVNVNRKNVVVENNVDVQATSDTVTAASLNPDMVAAFMGRDDADGQRDQSISRDQSNNMGTPERKERDINDTFDSVNVPIMRLPVDSSTPFRTYQVGK